MKKELLVLPLFLFSLSMLSAQEIENADSVKIAKIEAEVKSQGESLKKLQRLKISGYIQTQYQWGQENASLKVGSANENNEMPFGRMGIRRGRLKFAYEYGIATGVVQIDATEKGIGLKDAYFRIKEPFLDMLSIKAGVFDRPFGHEISYSSSMRESPERSTIFQTLFPEERDLGAMITLQGSKKTGWDFLKLEAGLFAGNGIKLDTDNNNDFIGHLTFNKHWKNIAFGVGTSYYHGGVYQGSKKVYSINDKAFVLDSNENNKGKFAKRQYLGFDAQLFLKSILGTTQVRAEYLMGRQPAKMNDTKSPNSSQLPNFDTYIRDFAGGYVIFVQSIGKLPVSAIFKYDWYDPNTQVAKEEIGINNTTKTDIKKETFGFGLLWQINANLRLQTYFDINKNERTSHIAECQKDIKDNTLTVRLQYKF